MTLIGHADPLDLSASTANITDDTNATHTHAVVASANPGAAETLLKSTVDGGLTLEELTVNIEANLTKLLTTQVGSHLIPDLPDTHDLGSSVKLWRKAWISELESVLFAENTISVIGGWFVIPKASGTLAVGINASITTVNFGQAMTINDFIVLRSSTTVEYMKIISLNVGTTYNVTRNVDGSGGNNWGQGQVYMVLGNTGNGRIEFNATDTPRISILEQGATYNAQTELIRLGDLDGNWGYGSITHGMALGQYASNKANMTWDATNGLRLRTYNNTVLQLDNAGNAFLQGVLNLGTSGGIFQGTGSFASPTTGLKIWNDSGVGAIAGFNSGAKQWWGDTDGKFYFANGDMAIGEDGIEFIGSDESLGTMNFAYGTFENETSEYLSINHEIKSWPQMIKHAGITLSALGSMSGGFSNPVSLTLFSPWSIATAIPYVSLTTDGNKAILYRDKFSVDSDITTAKGIAVGYKDANPDDDAIEFYYGSTKIGDIGCQDTSWLRINQSSSRNIYTPRFFRAEQGLMAGYAGASPGAGSVAYSGNLRPYRNSTLYTAYAYVPLYNPGTHTSWDGNDHKAPANYYITVSNWSSVPSNCTAVIVELRGQPTSTSTVLYIGGGSVPVHTVQYMSAEVNKTRTTNLTVPLSGGQFLLTIAGASFNWVTLRITGYYI